MMTLINVKQAEEILDTNMIGMSTLIRAGILKVVKVVDGVKMFDEAQVLEIKKEEDAKRERLAQMRAAAAAQRELSDEAKEILEEESARRKLFDFEKNVWK